MLVTPDSILAYCMEHLEGVVLRESWGERGIYYNPGETLPRGVYILTIKEKDGEMTAHLSLTGRAFTGSIWGCANHPSGRCLGNCPNARRRAGWLKCRMISPRSTA